MMRTIPDLRCIWWRGKVRIDGDRILPIQDKLKPYNPFDYYSPRQETTRQRTRSLYHEFLNVQSEEIEVVAQFCEKYGVIGDLEANWLSLGQPYPELFPNFPAESDKFSSRPTQHLCVPLILGDFQYEQSAFQQAYNLALMTAKGRARKEVKQARTDLGERFRAELEKTRFALIWDKKQNRWLQKWETLTLTAALYLMLAFDLQGPGRPMFCRRCGKSFLAEHPRATYCSPKCQNAEKVRRFRVKHSKAQHSLPR